MKFNFTDADISYRIIAENKHAVAFLNKMPILPGHTLICPKKPISLSEDLTFDMLQDILKLKSIICTKLKKTLGATGFNFAWNEGLVAGQTVSHFHLHIVPRKKDDNGIVQYEPRVFLYRPGSRANAQKEELENLAEELKEI